MAGKIILELDVELPDEARLSRDELALLMDDIRQIAKAGAVAALNAVLSETSRASLVSPVAH